MSEVHYIGSPSRIVHAPSEAEMDNLLEEANRREFTVELTWYCVDNAWGWRLFRADQREVTRNPPEELHADFVTAYTSMLAAMEADDANPDL